MNASSLNQSRNVSLPFGQPSIFFIKLPDNVPQWYYWGETKLVFQFQISMIFVNFFLRSVAFTVNLVTINVIRTNKKLHSPLNFLIASLCIADAFAFMALLLSHIP